VTESKRDYEKSYWTQLTKQEKYNVTSDTVTD
jgi:hypothetical protein